jgi:hypothetical protein
MNKTFILLGASVLMLGVMPHQAEARKVRYEINGKQYSYSTNNIAQTAEAKRRIAAAKAAEAVKARAEEEKARFPLAAAFGSQTQKEAAEAQKQLEQLLSGEAKPVEAAQPARERRVVRGTKPQDKPSPQILSAKAPQQTLAPIKVAASQAGTSRPPLTLPIAEPLNERVQTKIKSVTFDVTTGIKTTIMMDGAVEEEPFDSGMLAHLDPELGPGNSLMAFVKQLRKTAPEDAVGSITPKNGQPEYAEAQP